MKDKYGQQDLTESPCLLLVTEHVERKCIVRCNTFDNVCSCWTLGLLPPPPSWALFSVVCTLCFCKEWWRICPPIVMSLRNSQHQMKLSTTFYGLLRKTFSMLIISLQCSNLKIWIMWWISIKIYFCIQTIDALKVRRVSRYSSLW